MEEDFNFTEEAAEPHYAPVSMFGSKRTVPTPDALQVGWQKNQYAHTTFATVASTHLSKAASRSVPYSAVAFEVSIHGV